MTRWFGRTLRVIAVLSSASIAIESAPAAPLRSAAELAEGANATDIGARRSNRHTHSHRLNRQPSQPHYYERPYYYAPYPYSVPAPFVFGFGPWVWW
jgi:hypothetical protein